MERTMGSTTTAVPQTSVHRTVQDGVAEVVLHEPPSNILKTATLEALAGVFCELHGDPAVRAVLLRAEGRYFSAGVDVGEHLGEAGERMLRGFHAAVMSIWDCPVPTLAAVQGMCLGGGLELALAADLTCAAGDARLGQPEVQVGVFPPVAAALLPAEIGAKNALDLLLTGRTLTGEEAHRMGLIQRVWPLEQLLEEARTLARRLAGFSRPVLVACKRAVREAAARPFPAALERAEAVYAGELMPTHDAIEGLRAFLEKRKPVWKHA